MSALQDYLENKSSNRFVKNKNQQANLTEEEQAWEITQSLLSSLSLSSKKKKLDLRNHTMFMRMVSSVLKMKEEGIVDDNEAEELLRFIISRFVGNRFDEIFETIFNRDYTSPSFKNGINWFNYE